MKMSESSDQGFPEFRRGHPVYDRIYADLERLSPMMARSAHAVFLNQGAEALARVAVPILEYCESHFPADFLKRYIRRTEMMAEMQMQFINDPSVQTLNGQGIHNTVISTETYNIALLLSIVFSNHRFEIMKQLCSFLELLKGKPAGRLAAVGIGTGYELALAGHALAGWKLDGFDPGADEKQIRRMLSFMNVAAARIENTSIHKEFAPDIDSRPERYDAFVLCEILEHLPDPAEMLERARRLMRPGGRLFVTMAVNLAQEIHIYLYESPTACREQLRESGFQILHESFAPVTLRRVTEADRAAGTYGNYIAIVTDTVGTGVC